MTVSDGKLNKFVAHSFSREFKISDITRVLNSQPGLTDAKNITFRKDPDGGVIYAFNFGALAFLNVSESTRRAEVTNLLKNFDGKITSTIIAEDFAVEERPSDKPQVGFAKLIVDVLTPERAEVIALTIAQSTSMEYYESLIHRIWQDVTPQVERLRNKGSVWFRHRALQRLIGEVVSIRNSVIGMLHLLDKPDIIWSDNVMDAVYADLRSVFDLQERFQAMQYQLENIQDNLEILIDLIRDMRQFWVEMAILVLISLEFIMLVVNQLK